MIYKLFSLIVWSNYGKIKLHREKQNYMNNRFKLLFSLSKIYVLVTNSYIATLYNKPIIMNISIKCVHLSIDYRGDEATSTLIIFPVPLVVLLNRMKNKENFKSQFF